MSYWVKEILFRKGGLHRQLGINSEKKIPVSILNKIMHAEIGEQIKNKGKTIRVNALLKKRANLALNLRKMRKR